MNARKAILSKIRDKTEASNAQSPPEFAIELPQPDYGFDIEEDKTGLFVKMLERVHGSWEMLAKPEGIPNSVANYLTKAGAPLQAAIAPDRTLTELDWADMLVQPRAAEETDGASVTMAFAGIAETATIAMVSCASSPTTLNFLPEINIVVLEESRLVATMEQFWPMITTPPRAINFITGPSKTADIEQTIVYGAHGPKRFHVLILQN